MTSEAQTSVIIDAVRSPIGAKKGKMAGMRPDELMSQVLANLLARTPDFPVETVDDVVLGCAFPEGAQGMLLARAAAVLAGIPIESGGKVVNRFCGSSMDALHQVDMAIRVGDYHAAIACGIEDMVSVPMGGFNPSFHSSLAQQNYYVGMGETAENLARDGNISREAQEDFAVLSHRKALSAWSDGLYANEVCTVQHGDTVIEQDECPREPNVEKMKSLKPVFLQDGSVTAATSSPISIGAAAILMTSETLASDLGLKPRARIVSRAIAGVEWERMGMGPLPAAAKALERANLMLEDIDVIELNEAFAAQALYVINTGEWPMEKINLNGGAIAIGHPLGCSGARIVTTLLNVMDQQDARLGLATMCIGSGQGIATIIERITEEDS